MTAKPGWPSSSTVPAIRSKTIQVFDLYEAILIWDDERIVIDVAVAETEPLMGMSLIYGHDLRIQAIEDGRVTIEKLIYM